MAPNKCYFLVAAATPNHQSLFDQVARMAFSALWKPMSIVDVALKGIAVKLVKRLFSFACFPAVNIEFIPEESA